MRIATWNCGMALHRKFDAMLSLRPDIAGICECAEPRRLQQLAVSPSFCANVVWIGDNRNKGLAVFAFNDYAVRLAAPFHPTLRHVAPVRVTGPVVCNLLAVWAQNGSGGVSRKHQLGPLRRALTTYRGFLSERSSVVAGDFNNNVYWHRPGWRINHGNAVASLEKLGLASAYHVLRGEVYHIDYVFLPVPWLSRVRELVVGTYEEWCGSGLSDHVPILVDINC